jgi:2-iminobutanoate/2-iminopropanoate deaminase
MSAPGALAPYSASVEANGFVFFSGRIGATKAPFDEEVSTTIGALEVELKRLDLTFKDLVLVTVYLTDMSQYEAFNAIYERMLPAPYPARACVAVSGLPAGAHVEIQAIARAR